MTFQGRVIGAVTLSNTTDRDLEDAEVNLASELAARAAQAITNARLYQERTQVAATLQASRVIKGWQEALGLMKPGAKWQLFVPPELAYDLSSPPGIPPGSLLIFDVELIRANSPPPAAAK